MKKADSSKASQTQRKQLGLPDQSAKALSFWFCAGLLVILVSSIMSRDITRPFYGLHSWGQAHFAWVARSHVKYGLGYTKGYDTFAVGNPPVENPPRYLNHPPLPTLLDATAMAIFGINVWALRVAHAFATVLALLIFLKILRGLLDDKTALLAGLFFALFPITGYFGTYNTWLYCVVLSAFWSYLVLIGALKNAPSSGKFHKWSLAISLFVALQLTWEGFFWALAIGVHYIFHCIRRRQFPDKVLLAILIIAPLSSLILDFVILAGGHNWDLQRIIELAKWRTGKGEMEHVMAKFDWGKWFARVWEFALTNFTLPVLIVAIGYLTIGQLYVFAARASDKSKGQPSRRFPQFWLFFMVPVFQLFILKGTLWQHQYWERPLVPFVAIAAALGVMLLADILRKLHPRLAVVGVVVLIGVLFTFCVLGTNYYFSVKWRAPRQMEMFQTLNTKIPPDKALLSFEPHIIDQKPGIKQASYRPEVAWYLDRDVVVARTLEDIEQKAKTGKYPYYLIPRVDALTPLINQLAQRYKYDYVPGKQAKRTKDGKFLEIGMYSYMIFDLTSKPDAQ